MANKGKAKFVLCTPLCLSSICAFGCLLSAICLILPYYFLGLPGWAETAAEEQTREAQHRADNEALSQKRFSTGVSHSEFLAPVAPGQRPGQVYRPVVVAKRKVSKAKEFLLPAWLAGTWQRVQAREVSRVELPSGKRLRPVGTTVARVRDRFGTYSDAQGRIWQVFWPSRSSGEIDRGSVIDIHHVQEYNLAIINPKMVVVEVQAIHTVVGKGNRRIISVYQDEELNKYSPVGSDGLATDSSVKVFDHQGRPIYLTRTLSSQSRIAPFNGPSKPAAR